MATNWDAYVKPLRDIADAILVINRYIRDCHVKLVGTKEYRQWRAEWGMDAPRSERRRNWAKRWRHGKGERGGD